MKTLDIAYVGSARNRFVIPYIEHMQSMGHKVTLYNLDRYPGDMSVQNRHLIDVSCGVDPRNSWSKWRYGLAALKLRAALARASPDILHAHYASSAGLVCMLSGFRPYIVSVRGSDVLVRSKSRLWRAILRQVLSRSSLVHAVSHQLADHARALVDSDLVPVRTLTQGVELHKFEYHQRAKPMEPMKVLVTRSLAPIYDNETILHACSILRDEGVVFRLTFAAGGPLQDHLTKVADQLGISESVEFIGGYSNDMLPDIMRDHDVYVSASLSDGTSVSLLEAMSSGLFPVVSRIPANESWIGRDAGLLFEPGDATSLAGALRMVISYDDFSWRNATRMNRERVSTSADRVENMAVLHQWYQGIT